MAEEHEVVRFKDVDSEGVEISAELRGKEICPTWLVEGKHGEDKLKGEIEF